MSTLKAEFAVLTNARPFTRLPAALAEMAYRAFPARLTPPNLNTGGLLAQRAARHEADRAGMIPQPFVCEHLEVGDEPHKGHVLLFRFEDGTTQYFPPHRA